MYRVILHRDRADFFITDMRVLFFAHNLSARYHQIQRLMYEHPGAKLFLFNFKPKCPVNHLVEELRSVTGIEARYVSFRRLLTEKCLARDLFAD